MGPPPQVGGNVYKVGNRHRRRGRGSGWWCGGGWCGGGWCGGGRRGWRLVAAVEDAGQPYSRMLPRQRLVGTEPVGCAVGPAQDASGGQVPDRRVVVGLRVGVVIDGFWPIGPVGRLLRGGDGPWGQQHQYQADRSDLADQRKPGARLQVCHTVRLKPGSTGGRCVCASGWRFVGCGGRCGVGWAGVGVWWVGVARWVGAGWCVGWLGGVLRSRVARATAPPVGSGFVHGSLGPRPRPLAADSFMGRSGHGPARWQRIRSWVARATAPPVGSGFVHGSLGPRPRPLAADSFMGRSGHGPARWQRIRSWVARATAPPVGSGFVHGSLGPRPRPLAADSFMGRSGHGPARWQRIRSPIRSASKDRAEGPQDGSRGDDCFVATRGRRVRGGAGRPQDGADERNPDAVSMRSRSRRAACARVTHVQLL